MKPTWRIECGDCLELLRAMPDGCVDAVVTDPPYGINAVKAGKCFGTSNACATTTYRPIAGDDVKFDPSHLLDIAPITVLFGANHFSDLLPAKARWLIWDKRDGMGSNPLADCEMAWTSDTRPARVYSQRWMGMVRDGFKAPREHPSQKPVELMRWVLDVMGIPIGATVVDPYCGSGSTGVACMQSGRNFVGFDKDQGYCEIARRRCREAEDATALFDGPREPVEVQPSMFGDADAPA